jgi:hypothetical protein
MHATIDVTVAGLDSAGRLAPDDLQMLNRAVLSACDKLDGVEDGVLEDPRRCRFDPASLQCKPGSAPGTCLTAAQIATVRRVYGGPRDARTGAQLYPGLPFGSEAAWQVLLDTDRPFPIPLSFYRWIVFADSQWNWKTFDPRRPTDYAALQRADSQYAPVLSAIDPDLGRFRQRGGKLIQFHGWNDQIISAANSVAYYESVLARSGRYKTRALRDVQEFYRLYMVPGMFHCGGGPGLTCSIWQTALGALGRAEGGARGGRGDPFDESRRRSVAPRYACTRRRPSTRGARYERRGELRVPRPRDRTCTLTRHAQFDGSHRDTRSTMPDDMGMLRTMWK